LGVSKDRDGEENSQNGRGKEIRKKKWDGEVLIRKREFN